MDFLLQIGAFGAKTFFVASGTIVVAGFVFLLFNRSRSRPPLEVEKLNERYDAMRSTIKSRALHKKALKASANVEKKKKKAQANRTRRVFVLDFDGDLRASAVESLREEVTAILSLEPTDQDEVVIRLESPGGLVNAYGLCSAQLERIRARNIPLVACVDKVAASGGYMMACVANRIVATPFAVVGSIGVIAGVPNIHRLIEKYDVDYREVTAGQWKRTVSLLGEITPQGLEKFRSQIEETHELFKRHVSRWRPQLDMAKAATGEYWYGTQALELGLVDSLQTSDDYLMAKRLEADVFRVQFHARKTLSDKLAESLTKASLKVGSRAWTALRNGAFGT